MIVLCTVPHTGTQFFRQMFLNHGLIERGLDDVGEHESERVPGYFTALHVTADGLASVRRVTARVRLVTTVRDWDAVRASWRRRNKDLDTLERYAARWHELLKLEPFILSVDCDRERRLDDFRRLTGIDFQTNWLPINQSK